MYAVIYHHQIGWPQPQNGIFQPGKPISVLCWLLGSSARNWKLSCYFTLIIFREQHEGQTPSLATRAHQTLDKTRDLRLYLWHTFRSNLEPVFLSHFKKFWKQALHINQRIPDQYDQTISKPTSGSITSKEILGGLCITVIRVRYIWTDLHLYRSRSKRTRVNIIYRGSGDEIELCFDACDRRVFLKRSYK